MDAEQNSVEKSENTAPETKKEREKLAEGLEFFLELFQSKESIEEKLRFALHFMRVALSEFTPPRFRDFWEARRLCLPLFKENITHAVRSELWAEYIQLSKQAKSLREIVEEQSVFAAEQIELAIQSVEKDLERYEELLSGIDSHLEDIFCQSLQAKRESYLSIQKELQLLNALASRVNSLRKELIKTQMRMRFKNNFFDRLSEAGDKIFPKRKELIKKLSEQFIADVLEFVAKNFETSQEDRPPLYFLREEIKALQACAKAFTLNTQGFTLTRLKLSECWDKVKEWEKERKKEVSEKRQVSQKNLELILQKIQVLSEFCAKEESKIEEAESLTQEIKKEMRAVVLGSEELRIIKDEIFKARRPLLDRIKQKEDNRQKKEEEAERLKREKINQVRDGLDQLLQKAETLDAQTLSEERDLLFKHYESLVLSKMEKPIFEKFFKRLRDLVLEKKERVMIAHSSQDLESLGQLKEVLRERIQLQSEIKKQLEIYRKSLGSSGFDFEKAMAIRELIEEEKARLEKVEAAIQEIEDKIVELESG